MAEQAQPKSPLAGSPAAPTAGLASPSAYPRGAVLLLMFVYLFNMLDRQILTILVEPIKTDLHLADWQIGAISGLAFALLYTIAGIPLARVADRGDRVRMIAVALVVWSSFTILCGATRSFGEMLLARVGVGVGEAGCTPAAHSLITDYVPRERRASALAFYQLGTPLGALVGLMLGGFVLAALDWRWAFLIAGAPGILLAGIVLMTLNEPRRVAVSRLAGADGVTLRLAVRTLMAKKSFWCICLGSGLSAFAFFGQSAFLGSLYLRTHTVALTALARDAGMAPTALLGVLLGVMVGIGGGLGTVIGGRLADRIGHRGLLGYLMIPAFALGGGAPLFAGAALADDMTFSLILLGGAFLIHAMSYGPAYAAIQTLAEPRMRGMATALQIFFVNGIGLALGPLFVGAISDVLRDSLGPVTSLRVAMSLVGIPLIAATGLFILSRRWIDGDDAH